MKEYKDYAKITAHFDLAIEEAIKFGGDVGKHAVLLFETMRNELDTVPAADVVEVRHAKWVSSEQYNGRPECSACFYVTDEKTNYCPHCGCKMDREVEELNPVEKILKAKADWYRSLAPLPASVKSALLSGNWDEPKSITRPELPDPPEPETITFGEYVEITEMLDINKLFQICPICDNKTTVIYSQTLNGRDWYECFGCNAIFGIRREE